MHVFLQCMYTNSTCVSSQSAEGEGEIVHLQHEFLETNTKMTQLDGQCCNGTLLKTKTDMVVALTDELKMVKKISAA